MSFIRKDLERFRLITWQYDNRCKWHKTLFINNELKLEKPPPDFLQHNRMSFDSVLIFFFKTIMLLSDIIFYVENYTHTNMELCKQKDARNGNSKATAKNINESVECQILEISNLFYIIFKWFKRQSGRHHPSLFLPHTHNKRTFNSEFANTCINSKAIYIFMSFIIRTNCL